jgi:hypothetical protein
MVGPETFTGVGGGRRLGSAVSAIRMSSRMPLKRLLPSPVIGSAHGPSPATSAVEFDTLAAGTELSDPVGWPSMNQVNAWPCRATTAVGRRAHTPLTDERRL